MDSAPSTIVLQQPRIRHLARFCGGVFCFVIIAGNAFARDFHSPGERPIDGTAYTADAKQWRFKASIFGTQYEDLLASLGISFAPFRFWEFGINLAHLGVGIANLHTKFNILDINGFGLGVKLDFMWAHGRWLWVLPKSQKRILRGVDLFVIPIQLLGSIDATRWLHFDLSVGFTDAELLGHLSGNALFYDGYLGARMVALQPVARFYTGERVSIELSAHLPLWAQVRHEVVSDVTLTPGVRGGIRSAGYKTQKPLYYWLVALGVVTEVATRLYLGVQLSVGPYTEKIYSNRINTGLKLEWRF